MLATQHLLDEIRSDSEYANELNNLKTSHEISDILSEIRYKKKLERFRWGRLKLWFKKLH